MSVSRNDSLNLRFLAVSSEPSPPRFRVPPLRISRPDSPPSDPVPQALKDTVSAALSEVAAAEGVTLFDVLRAACAVYADVSREDADHNSVRTNFSRVPVTPLVTDRSIVGPAVPPGGSRSAPSQPEGGWLHLNVCLLVLYPPLVVLCCETCQMVVFVSMPVSASMPVSDVCVCVCVCVCV